MPTAALKANIRLTALNRLPVINGSKNAVNTATVEMQLMPTEAFEYFIAA